MGPQVYMAVSEGPSSAAVSDLVAALAVDGDEDGTVEAVDVLRTGGNWPQSQAILTGYALCHGENEPGRRASDREEGAVSILSERTWKE